MAKVYYIGDWAVQTGPVYAETPFNYSYKGLEVINYGSWLKEALEAAGHEVASVPTWEFYALPPGGLEKVLADNDAIVFSDVEAKNFQLAPSFFDRRKFGTAVLTFPDRVRLVVEAVKAGKRAAFLGGWLSFNGECGKGGWGRTGLREILPVECLEVEDLVESTEGFVARALPGVALPGVDFSSMPPVLGYNRVRPRAGCEVLASWRHAAEEAASGGPAPGGATSGGATSGGATSGGAGEAGDPALAFGRFGRGATLAYTSDPAPHWGCNFVFWEGYRAFWKAAFTRLLA